MSVTKNGIRLPMVISTFVFCIESGRDDTLLVIGDLVTLLGSNGDQIIPFISLFLSLRDKLIAYVLMDFDYSTLLTSAELVMFWRSFLAISRSSGIYRSPVGIFLW